MLNTTATISRPTRNKQASGAYELDAHAAIYSNIPCSLQPDSSSLVIEHKRLTGVRGATLYLPPTFGGSAVSVQAEDIASVGGVTWRCVGPSIDASAGRGEVLRVPLEAPLQ